MNKQRVIKSYENLDSELIKQFEDTYPESYKDKVLRLTNSKNENFFVDHMETENVIYLVKVQLAKPDKIKDDNDDDFEDSDEEKDDDTDTKSNSSNENKEESYAEDYDLD